MINENSWLYENRRNSKKEVENETELCVEFFLLIILDGIFFYLIVHNVVLFLQQYLYVQYNLFLDSLSDK